MVSATMAATIACITCFRSAGITNHGAQSVEVAVIACFERVHVVVPQGAFRDVVGVELPQLVGIVETSDEPALLLVLRHVQEELHDLRAGVVEVAFEGIDVLEPLAPEAVPAIARGQALSVQPLGMNPKRNDLFVVRAVEDADPSPLRQRLRDAPQEVVVELSLEGALKEATSTP